MFFVEDVLPPEQIEWYREIRKVSATPQAVGEVFTNPKEYYPLIAERLIDYVRCRVTAIGGITPAKKLATVCEIFGVKTAFQEGGENDPVNLLAAYHVDISSTAFGIQEENHFPPSVHEMLPGTPEIRRDTCYGNEAGSRDRHQRRDGRQIPDRRASQRRGLRHRARRRRHNHHPVGGGQRRALQGLAVLARRRPRILRRLGVGRVSPWNIRVISPASRRYQSLGSSAPSASSASQKPCSGASLRFDATLKIAVPSFTSSNMAIFRIFAPGDLRVVRLAPEELAATAAGSDSAVVPLQITPTRIQGTPPACRAVCSSRPAYVRDDHVRPSIARPPRASRSGRRSTAGPRPSLRRLRPKPGPLRVGRSRVPHRDGVPPMYVAWYGSADFVLNHSIRSFATCASAGGCAGPRQSHPPDREHRLAVVAQVIRVGGDFDLVDQIGPIVLQGLREGRRIAARDVVLDGERPPGAAARRP